MHNRWNAALAVLLALLTGCVSQPQQQERAEIDSLNTRAYAFRYVVIDSTASLAQRALELSADYPDGRNEARCNLAFVKYQQMDFDAVDSILNLVQSDSRNPLFLLCADVLRRACNDVEESRTATQAAQCQGGRKRTEDGSETQRAAVYRGIRRSRP